MSEEKPRYEWIAEMMYEAGLYTQSETVRNMGREHAALSARVAELERDALRLDWCERTGEFPQKTRNSTTGGQALWAYSSQNGWLLHEKETAREVIDAAMRGTE